MTSTGQTDTAELIAMLRERGAVSVRLALVAAPLRAEGSDDAAPWQLHYGEVALDDEAVLVERIWRYPTALFLELFLPGAQAAALLRGGTHDIHGIRVFAAPPQFPTASSQRLRGQEEWGRVTTQWPRTEWSISRDPAAPQPGYDVLLGGDGPSFSNFDQALSAFLYGRPHDHNANRSDLWRIVLPQRGGWFTQISVAADLLTVDIAGTALDGAMLELSAAVGNEAQPAAAPGTYWFKLPHGLQHESLLILRRHDQWLDLRTFPMPVFGRARDASIVWEQPGPELEMLLAAGEGQHLECKREVPEGESRKKMLKTIAAFASQDGGTVLIGVQDDLQITGLPDPEKVDKQALQVVNMIRDTVEPVPPYATRVIDHDGKKVLAVEVSGGGQMYAYRSGQRLEFYVRVGPNTVPARHHEVAAGFRQT